MTGTNDARNRTQERTMMTTSKSRLQTATSNDRNALSAAIAEKYNVMDDDVTIDDEGDVCINPEGRSAWLDADKLDDLAAWLDKTYPGWDA